MEHRGYTPLHPRTTQLRGHHRDEELTYEVTLERARQRRNWALGTVRWLANENRGKQHTAAEIANLPSARNGQQSVGRWPVLFGPLWYLQLLLTCAWAALSIRHGANIPA